MTIKPLFTCYLKLVAQKANKFVFSEYFAHCVKYRSFAERHSFHIVSGESDHPKLCGNCAFPQNFRTRKLGEITVFYAVVIAFKDTCEGNIPIIS